MNLDLRNSADDNSQRMLNAIEPGTVIPIHRHMGSSETCLCVRGHFVCSNWSMAHLENPRKRYSAVRMQRLEVGAAEPIRRSFNLILNE